MSSDTKNCRTCKDSWMKNAFKKLRRWKLGSSNFV